MYNWGIDLIKSKGDGGASTRRLLIFTVIPSAVSLPIFVNNGLSLFNERLTRFFGSHFVKRNQFAALTEYGVNGIGPLGRIIKAMR